MHLFVTGATGFIGRRVVARLASQGHAVRCLVRRTSDLGPLTRFPVEGWAGDVTEPETLEGALDGITAIIHLVGIIREHPPQATFDRVHVAGTRNLVAAAGNAAVQRFVFLSALGAGSDSPYPYMATKGRAEALVLGGSVGGMVIRSSIVYGPGDEFLNKLAALVRHPPTGDRTLAPFVPVIGSGRTQFQPIHADDVARCVTHAATDGAPDGVVEIGGPERFSYEALIDLVMEATGVRRPKVHVPVALMRPVVRLMPLVYRDPPITPGQLDMIGLDSVCALDGVVRHFGFEPARLRERIDYLAA
jgi:NADH dehydrogenase